MTPRLRIDFGQAGMMLERRIRPMKNLAPPKVPMQPTLQAAPVVATLLAHRRAARHKRVVRPSHPAEPQVIANVGVQGVAQGYSVEFAVDVGRSFRSSLDSNGIR